MKIVCTSCSINHLAQAKTLGDSLLKYNPDTMFVIALVDKITDHSILPDLSRFTVIEIGEMQIPDLEGLASRYNIFELSCFVKPFALEYLFKKYHPAEGILYLDSDIMVFDNLTPIFDKLKECDIAITPHITAPALPDERFKEEAAMQGGLYNAGFIGIAYSENAQRFLSWWKKKVTGDCGHCRTSYIFVDQKYLDLVPLFFERVGILKDEGLNIGHWNVERRRISEEGGKYFVNGKYPLIFFHFSGHDLGSGVISRFSPIQLSEREDLRPLHELYEAALLANGNESLKGVSPYYMKVK